MQEFKTLLVSEPVSHVGLIQLNRPERNNALSTELRYELRDAVDYFNAKDDIGCIVLTGGPNVFAIGADLEEQRGRDALGAMGAYTNHAVAESRLPVIAAVNGAAFGGGSEIALQADFIVASDTAVFKQPEVISGFVPGGGATVRLPSFIGKGRAMFHLLTGAEITAEAAERYGLVTQVVEGDAVPAAVEIAAVIATHPRYAVEHIKRSVKNSLDVGESHALAYERRSFELMYATEELPRNIAQLLNQSK